MVLAFKARSYMSPLCILNNEFLILEILGDQRDGTTGKMLALAHSPIPLVPQAPPGVSPWHRARRKP